VACSFFNASEYVPAFLTTISNPSTCGTFQSRSLAYWPMSHITLPCARENPDIRYLEYRNQWNPHQGIG
jgi:hypothetical protein